MCYLILNIHLPVCCVCEPHTRHTYLHSGCMYVCTCMTHLFLLRFLFFTIALSRSACTHARARARTHTHTHTHTHRCYDSWIEDGEFYVCLELCDKGDLSCIVKQQQVIYIYIYIIYIHTYIYTTTYKRIHAYTLTRRPALHCTAAAGYIYIYIYH